MPFPNVCSDTHEGALTVFTFTDGSQVKGREVMPIHMAPYVVVTFGTSILIKNAITRWSNLECVEGQLEAT